jgi:hypothetical protein
VLADVAEVKKTTLCLVITRKNRRGVMDNAFDILQLPKSASLEDIDKNWKTLVRTVHPDKIGAVEGTKKTQILNEAREKARQMYHGTECTRARFLQQHSNGATWTEEGNMQEGDAWMKHMFQAQWMEEIARANAAESRQMEDQKQKISQMVKRYITRAYEDERKIHELQEMLKTESICTNKAEQLAEESIHIAEEMTKQLQQTRLEIQTKDAQLKELLQQIKIKDLMIEVANLKDAKRAAELDQKKKELDQSEQERVVLEEKLLTLQMSLDDEKQHAEMAEDRAKEWEHKCNEIQTLQHQNKSKKRRKDNDADQLFIKYEQTIKQFMDKQLEEVPRETSKMLTTRELYESFLDGCDEDKRPTFIHFSREISRFMEEMFPNVRHVRNSSFNGYVGIKMKADSPHPSPDIQHPTSSI